MLVLTSSLWISSRASSPVDPSNLHLVISNNCSKEFLPSNVSSTTNGAFSLDKLAWDVLSSKCNETWSAEVNSTVVLMNAGEPSQAVENLHSSRWSEKQHLKLVVLLATPKTQRPNWQNFAPS
jgi:hypothetical protein